MDWRERTYYWVQLNYNSRPLLIFKDWDIGGRNYERRVKELKKIPALRMHPLPSMALDREKREAVPRWAQMLVSCRRAHLSTLMNTFIRFGAESYGNFRWEAVKKETGAERKQMEAGRKLKVGDTVRILDGSKARNYFGLWAAGMSEYVGKRKVIKGFVCEGRGVMLLGTPYDWDARYLELVEEAKAAEPAVEPETETVAEKWNKEFKIRNSAGVLTVKAERELSLREVFFGIGDDALPAMQRPRLEVHEGGPYGGMLITLSDRASLTNDSMYVVEIPPEYEGKPRAWVGRYETEVPDGAYVTMEPWREG